MAAGEIVGKGRCICIFSALYHPSMGGVETYAQNIATELGAQGLRPIVVTSALGDDAGLAIEDGVEVYRLPSRPLLGGRYPMPRKNAEYQLLWNELAAQPIDWVVVNTRFYPLSQEGAALARAKGIRPIEIEHGSAHLTMGSPLLDAAVQGVEHYMTGRLARFDPLYYGVSAKACEWLGHFGLQASGAIPNSIDAQAYSDGGSSRAFRSELGISDDTLLVASVGRLLPEKGVRQIIEAAAMLPQGADIKIAFAGDGPLLPELQSTGNGATIALGRLTPADTAALLHESDALILPSRSEGFATVLLEAAACNTPAITTDVGGVQELMGSRYPQLILPSPEPADIARKLQWAAENRAALAAIGGELHDKAIAEHTWAAAARKMVEACKAANEGPASAAG